MKHRPKKGCLIIGLTLLLIGTLLSPAFCQKASIKDVRVKGTNRLWKVSFYGENCFTEKMEEAVQSGIGTAFTFYLQLYQKRSWWKDRKVGSVHFHHIIQYDPIRSEYRVTLEENGSTSVTSDFERAKELMAKVEDVEIVPSSSLNPEVPTQLRIKAELDQVRLPLHLEYLLFFVSLWSLETDWHIEPLPP